jgi:ribosomal-protein-serine acetyltransferase
MLQVNDHILLRSHEEADAAELFKVINENRNHLRNFITWVDSTLKPEDSLEFIRTAHQHLHEQKGMSLGIFQHEKLIGGIGMHQWNHTLRKAEVGYWISKQEEGKGIMYDVSKAFIAFLFEQLHLNKIELHFKKENQRSAQLAQRLNFTIEGILRDSIFMNGTLHDLVIAGLLRREAVPR